MFIYKFKPLFEKKPNCFLVFLSSLCFFVITQVNAGSKNKCLYQYQPQTTKLEWTAFKTPKKVGVKVAFKEIQIQTKSGSSLGELLKGATFIVNPDSLDSGNPDRDKKIKNHFFKLDKPQKEQVTIKGTIAKVESSKVMVDFVINQVKKTVAMDYVLEGEQLKFRGKIDVLDFKLSDSLAAINTACKALHEGKTWSDVELELVTTLATSCQ
jgi:hypothetical protein